MTNNTDYLMAKLSPYLQFIPAKVDIVLLYLTNNEGLSPRALEQLSTSLINQLSTYVSYYLGRVVDIEFISIPITRDGITDMIILLNKNDLGGIDITDECVVLDRFNTKCINLNSLIGFDSFSENNVNKKPSIRLWKEYEGKKKDVISYLFKHMCNYETAQVY